MKKLFLLLALIVSVSFTSHSQNYTIEIGDADANVNETVSIPVTFKGFDSLNAFGLYLTFDKTKLTYMGIQNINPDIQGNFLYNKIDTIITAGWYGINTISLTNDVVFEIKFQLLSGYSQICYDIPNCDFSYNREGVMEEIKIEPSKINFICGSVSDKSIGINEVISRKDIIYPNPNNGILNVAMSGLENISIYNLSGKELLNKNFSGGSSIESYDISDFPKGVYLVKLTSSNNVSYKKLILK